MEYKLNVVGLIQVQFSSIMFASNSCTECRHHWFSVLLFSLILKVHKFAHLDIVHQCSCTLDTTCAIYTVHQDSVLSVPYVPQESHISDCRNVLACKTGLQLREDRAVVV